MNPLEQIWEELRRRGFRNEIFTTLEKIVIRLCDAVCSLSYEIIKSITVHNWIVQGKRRTDQLETRRLHKAQVQHSAESVGPGPLRRCSQSDGPEFWLDHRSLRRYGAESVGAVYTDPGGMVLCQQRAVPKLYRRWDQAAIQAHRPKKRDHRVVGEDGLGDSGVKSHWKGKHYAKGSQKTVREIERK